MGSVFVLFAFSGVLVYGLSWGSSIFSLSLYTNTQPSPILLGYSTYAVVASFLLTSNLNNPVFLVGESADYAIAGLGPMEVSVVGSLFLAVLAFFVLMQVSPTTVSGPAAVAGFVTMTAGLAFLFSDSFWLMFVSFEFLLLSALYMLLLTSKSERVSDAGLEMFMWTLVGSTGLLTGLGVIGSAITNAATPARWAPLTGLCFLVGFGVKVPLWPATSWLLKAHVEASVEFSMLLSGYMVKVGVLGLYSALTAADAPSLNMLVSALAVVGLLDAGSSLPSQSDLKRIVALTTVVEMNWAVLALSLGGAQQDGIAGYLCIAHCCTTTTEFLLVETLTKRFGTSDMSYIGGLALSAPLLWLMSVLAVLVTMGFPGTSLFWAKYVFFVGLLPTMPGLGAALAALFLVFLPMFFMSLWAMVWFGFKPEQSTINDLNASELFVLSLSMSLAAILGLTPGVMFWNLLPCT